MVGFILRSIKTISKQDSLLLLLRSIGSGLRGYCEMHFGESGFLWLCTVGLCAANWHTLSKTKREVFTIYHESWKGLTFPLLKVSTTMCTKDPKQMRFHSPYREVLGRKLIF